MKARGFLLWASLLAGSCRTGEHGSPHDGYLGIEEVAILAKGME